MDSTLLAERVATLEKQLRRQKTIGTAGLMAILAVVGLSAFGDGVQDAVRTRKLNIVNKMGASVVTIDAIEDGGRVIINGNNAVVHSLIQAGDDGGMFGLQDAHGKPRVMSGVTEGGDGIVVVNDNSGALSWTSAK